MNVLSVQQLGVSYGGVHALSDVSLEVGEGQLVGLIGPNGAGKTTFVDAVTGLVAARGRVELDGKDLTGRPPHVRARRGLARTFQSSELFEDLTVAENLQVTADPSTWWTALGETFGRRPSPNPAVPKALKALGLEDLAGASAHELSQGRRKLVGVARRPWQPGPASSVSTSPRPAWTQPRAPNSDADCARSLKPAPRCSSSTTT